MEKDKYFMEMALEEAKKAIEEGDYPIGSVLTFNGEYLDKDRNTLFTDVKWTSHAELKILDKNSQFLMKKYRENLLKIDESYNLCLYTTLEPCLMCLGAIVMHRVSRVIVACQDPAAGTQGIDFFKLTPFYHDKWPKISVGLMGMEASELIIRFAEMQKTPEWTKQRNNFLIINQQYKEKHEDSPYY